MKQNFVEGRLEPSIWVPSIMFLNTPNTDISLLDDKVSLTVTREGNYTLSSLDQLDQVSHLQLSPFNRNIFLILVWIKIVKFETKNKARKNNDLWYRLTEITPLRNINLIILYSSTIVLFLKFGFPRHIFLKSNLACLEQLAKSPSF